MIQQSLLSGSGGGACGVCGGDEDLRPSPRLGYVCRACRGPVRSAPFDGDDYVHERDHPRLSGQIQRVYDAMRDGAWLTLEELHELTGDPHASISAQIRHLRKPRFGGFRVDKRHRGDPANGLYEYRLDVSA